MATTEVIDIAPGISNVVLICGNPPNEVRLRVSSTILIYSSPVFKALLSPKFKEGTELMETNNVEIPLPDDCGSDMKIICDCLHLHNDLVPETLPPAQILSIARLTDKYDCIKAMRYMARMWTKPHLQTCTPSELNELLKATFYFNDTYLFNETCKSIISRTVGPIGDPGANAELEGLRSVLGELNRQRTSALDFIAASIDQRVKWVAQMKCPKRSCTFTSSMLSHFITELSKVSLYGAGERQRSSIAQLENDLRRFDCRSSQIDYAAGGCKSSGCNTIEDEGNKQFVLDEIAVKLEAQVRIPCFICACVGKPSFYGDCEHN